MGHTKSRRHGSATARGGSEVSGNAQAIGSSKLPWLAAGFVLLAATLLAYWPVFGHEFFAEWDDPDYVTANPHVQQGATLTSVAWAFQSTEAANWFPLTRLSHIVDWQLYGATPLGHHLSSLLLHAANSLLLWLLLSCMMRAAWRGWVVAALFALHPLHVESVAWVAERKDVLSAFFFLLSLLAYTRYTAMAAEVTRRSSVPRQNPPGYPGGYRFLQSPWSFYCLSLGCFALGLMSKPMLVSLPLLLLALDFWPLGRFGQAPGRIWRRLVMEKAPFLALSLASAAVTLLVQSRGGTVASASTVPIPARLANVPVAYARYLWSSVVPVDLSPLYPFDFHLPVLLVALCAGVLAGLTAIGWMNRKRHGYLFIGWIWYVVMLVPVIGLIQIGGQARADRYTYLPLIGIFVAGVWWVGDLLAARRQTVSANLTAAAATVTGIVLLSLAACTRHYLGFWQNSFTLWTRVLAISEACDTAHFNLGLLLATQEGKFQEAAGHFERAADLNPTHAGARFSLGLCMEKVGDRARAAQCYRNALAADPGYGPAHHNLAILLEMGGNQTEAITHYEAALKAMPQDAGVRTNLANCCGRLAQSLLGQGRSNEARQALERCRQLGGSPPATLDRSVKDPSH